MASRSESVRIPFCLPNNERYKDAGGIYPYRELFRLFRETGYDRVTLGEVGRSVPDADTVAEVLRYYKALWTELARG